jgi:hypothetical protein
MEVLNTHVCSLKSPAPGNEGHDGCLEFLRAQCIFFGRSFTIWDDEFFHFIDSEGKEIEGEISKHVIDHVLHGGCYGRIGGGQTFTVKVGAPGRSRGNRSRGNRSPKSAGVQRRQTVTLPVWVPYAFGVGLLLVSAGAFLAGIWWASRGGGS